MVRTLLLRAGGLAAIAAIALLAFATFGPAHKADAAGNQPSCTFTTPLTTILTTGGSDSVTCTLDVAGTTHTLTIDFTVTLTAHPPIAIDACTLDGNALHVGPCP